MKGRTKGLLGGFCVFCAVVFLCGQAWAIALSFNPATSLFNVGDSIDIDIVISGMESDDLSTFDFNVNYDDSILDFDSYTLGSELGVVDPSDPWADAEDWSWGYLVGGTINLCEVSWLWDLTFQPDSFTLATLSFTGISMGTSLLSFSNVVLGDERGDPLSAELGSGSVAPVPEPATVLLLSTGLVGLMGFRKKFRK